MIHYPQNVQIGDLKLNVTSTYSADTPSKDTPICVRFTFIDSETPKGCIFELNNPDNYDAANYSDAEIQALREYLISHKDKLK